MRQPITDENVKEFMSAIPDIDEDLTGRETISDLDKRPKLRAYLSHCTVERTYFFSIKKCGDLECEICKLPKLPSVVFEQLHQLPDPVPDEQNKGHYKPSNQVFGTETSEEKYLPSKTLAVKKTHGIPFSPSKQHASNTNIVVMCTECQKPRYAQKKVSPSVATKLFICQNHRYIDPVEGLYYSAGYTSCCIHCGKKRKLTTGSNEYPMCSDCRRLNKKPVQRRKSFAKTK